jgi:hypothetical protein
MRTPPIWGLTAFKIKARFMRSWPTIAVNGNTALDIDIYSPAFGEMAFSNVLLALVVTLLGISPLTLGDYTERRMRCNDFHKMLRSCYTF